MSVFCSVLKVVLSTAIPVPEAVGVLVVNCESGVFFAAAIIDVAVVNSERGVYFAAAVAFAIGVVNSKTR